MPSPDAAFPAPPAPTPSAPTPSALNPPALNPPAPAARFRAVSAMAPTLSVVIPSYNERANLTPMIARLDAALVGIAWEAIYVDDDSPDGTAAEVRRIAQADPRVRCMRRIGRRGSVVRRGRGRIWHHPPTFVAVIDADLQHDETRLPVMLEALHGGTYDLVVASRSRRGRRRQGLANRWRHALSGGGVPPRTMRPAGAVGRPMSGFFMLPAALFEQLARHLTAQGFKILLDLVLSAEAPLRVIEIPAEFRKRLAGESKLDVLVLTQFAGLLVDKALGGLLPLRFLSFAAGRRAGRRRAPGRARRRPRRSRLRLSSRADGGRDLSLR